MKTINILILFVLITSLLSCSSFFSSENIVLLSEKNKFLPKEILDFGDFVGVYFVVQLSVLLGGLLFMLFFGKLGYYISMLIHWIWIINYRNYGFWIVLLLFFGFTLVKFFILPFLSNLKRRY